MSIPDKLYTFAVVESFTPEVFHLSEVTQHLFYTAEEAERTRDGIEAKHLHTQRTMELSGHTRAKKIAVSKVSELSLLEVSKGQG